MKKGFALRLAETRTAAKISQHQLAAMTGISRQSIYEYERGRYKPKYSIAVRLANALKVDIDYLYYGKAKPTHNITYKDLLLHYLGLFESYIFTEKIVDDEGNKKLVMTTDNQEFIEYITQLKNVTSIQGTLKKSTSNLVITELMESYDITLNKEKDKKNNK